ncbi:hypothetical protein SAMN05421595_0368 [Austwickia chelonae]|nr:hypothetical protein SAMN05421595_0368 [Austwickia chelonae]
MRSEVGRMLGLRVGGDHFIASVSGLAVRRPTALACDDRTYRVASGRSFSVGVRPKCGHAPGPEPTPLVHACNEHRGRCPAARPVCGADPIPEHKRLTERWFQGWP